MSLNPKKYASVLWQGIEDPKAKRALMDLAQKVEQLARDAEARVAGMDAVPAGTIVFWLGTAASIPAGWSEVTSLRSKFPRGMASGGTPGTTGGSDTHTHGTGGSGTGGGKTSTTGPTGTGRNMRDGTGVTITLAEFIHDHNISQATILPPYVDGIWIQKD